MKMNCIAYIYIRMIHSESLLDIVKAPLKPFTSSSSSVSHNTVLRSKVNRETFKSIMAEIEEIEKEEKR